MANQIEITAPLDNDKDNKKAVPVILKNQPIDVNVKTNPVPVSLAAGSIVRLEPGTTFYPPNGWLYKTVEINPQPAAVAAMIQAESQAGFELVPMYPLGGQAANTAMFIWRKPR